MGLPQASNTEPSALDGTESQVSASRTPRPHFQEKLNHYTANPSKKQAQSFVMSHLHQLAMGRSRTNMSYENALETQKDIAPQSPFTDRRPLANVIQEGDDGALFTAFARSYLDSLRMSHSRANSFYLTPPDLSSYFDDQLIRTMLQRLGYPDIKTIPREDFGSTAKEDITRLGSAGLFPKTPNDEWQSGRELRGSQIQAMSELYSDPAASDRVKAIEREATSIATEAMKSMGVDERVMCLRLLDVLLTAKQSSAIHSVPVGATRLTGPLLLVQQKDDVWVETVDAFIQRLLPALSEP